MSAVAPVRQQQAFRPVFQGQFRAGPDIERRYVHPSGQAGVGVDGRADVIADAGVPVINAVGRHPLGLDQFVSPFQRYGVLRYKMIAFRIVVDHVSPEHDLFPVGIADMAVQFVQPFHEDNILPLLTAVLLDLVSAQAVSFIQADVHIFACKTGQQGSVQVFHKFKAFREQGIEGRRNFILRTEQPQMMEGRLSQPGIHMAE